MRTTAKNKAAIILSTLSLCCIYYWIGYELKRPQFGLLISLYGSAFALSIYLFKSGLSLKTLLGLSFGFKLIFLFSIPELSEDFYRFIWDGMLNTKGYNPYLHLPKDIIENESIREESISSQLFQNMSQLNATHYSTYPPLAQLIYTISYAIGDASLLVNVIVLRCFNLLAEIGIVWFGLKILALLKLPKVQILYFVLNPLVILESTFNLHFEVVMLFFLGMALCYLFYKNIYFSAIGLAGAVASKMLPLMFLPLLWGYFNRKKTPFNRQQVFKYTRFLFVFLVGLIFSYLFFFDAELIDKSSQTLSLYFTSFEFNASIYYLAREIGFLWTGYNQIEVIGRSLSLIVIGVIFFLSFKQPKIDARTLLRYMLFTSTIYYLLSTTVHPWYLMLPLFLSVFTTYKYMLVWSGLVFLSYSAYTMDGVEELGWLISIEYILVIVMITYETIFSKKAIS